MDLGVPAPNARRRAFPFKSSAGLPASGLSGTIPHANAVFDRMRLRVCLCANGNAGREISRPSERPGGTPRHAPATQRALHSEMDRPQRKSIRLRGYDYTRCGAYYITICTNDRLHVFGRIMDATVHLGSMLIGMGSFWKIPWLDEQQRALFHCIGS